MNILGMIRQKREEIATAYKKRQTEQYEKNVEELGRLKARAEQAKNMAATKKELATQKRELFKAEHPMLARVAANVKKKMAESKGNAGPGFTNPFGDSKASSAFSIGGSDKPSWLQQDKPKAENQKHIIIKIPK